MIITGCVCLAYMMLRHSPLSSVRLGHSQSMDTAQRADMACAVVSQDIHELVQSCMDLDPRKRPTARAVFECIRNTMARVSIDNDPAPMARRTSLQAQLQRRESMREALKQL